MRILALETSIGGGSIALLERTTVLYQRSLPLLGRTAQTLAPAMDAALRELTWSAAAIQLVAVTNGPGSFTGLRIGVTAAKTLAYLAQCDLIALNTLDVIIRQLPADISAAAAVMDAQRGQLFAASYRRLEEEDWETTIPCRIVERAELSAMVIPNMVLTGPALTKLPDTLLPELPRAERSCWIPQASTVGQLAWNAYAAGQRSDPLSVQPQYYRPSYAEEKRGKHGEAPRTKD